jgi:hypothetical protein
MPGIIGSERLTCPREFQDRITRELGTNMFGEPLFRLIWGQTQTLVMGFSGGYRERLVQFDMPCWVIQRWRSPNEYGSPEMYYTETFEEESKLYITGEYPWKGRYETLQPLYRKEVVNGKLEITHFPLDDILIDRVIPMMLKAQEMNFWERKAALRMIHDEEEEKKVDAIAERLEEARPSFMGSVSLSRQGCRTSRIDKMAEKIERTWNRISAGKKNWNRGLFQGRKFTH